MRNKQLSLIYYYLHHNNPDVIKLIFWRLQLLLHKAVENNLLQVLVSRFLCVGLSSRLQFARTYHSILWFMFNILSCLSHISFRVGLKIKFTMPYIFIDSQINYAVDIPASLVPHEHSRRSQSIWSQNIVSLLHRDSLRLDAWPEKHTHTYKILALFTAFVVWSRCKSSYGVQYEYRVIRKKKWECDTRQQTKKFSSLYRWWRFVIIFKEMSTTRCGLQRQVYWIPHSDTLFSRDSIIVFPSTPDSFYGRDFISYRIQESYVI